MSFPTSPTNGQIATLSNGITYSYTSATNYWARVPGAVSALPSFKNRLINGAMTFAQRSTGPISNTVASATLKYNTLDRWGYWAGANGYFYLEQSTTAPPGYNNSALITSGSATTVSSGVYATFSQRIEGYNILDLLWGTSTAQSVAVSFWINCSLTGTFSGYVFNSNYSYCYPFTFTIPTANTWVQITKLIPGPTSGTWNTTTGIGLEFGITLAAGSNFQDTANAWTTKSYAIGSAGSTNLLSTNGATMYITGVQLEAGASATTFDYRDYTRELQMCQRYYYRIQAFSGTSGVNILTANLYTYQSGYSPIILPVAMRTNPTGSYSALSDFYLGSAGNYVVLTSITANNGYASPNLVEFYWFTGANLTNGNSGFIRINNSSGWLDYSAEL
jgi:hypothetical protein